MTVICNLCRAALSCPLDLGLDRQQAIYRECEQMCMKIAEHLAVSHPKDFTDFGYAAGSFQSLLLFRHVTPPLEIAEALEGFGLIVADQLDRTPSFVEHYSITPKETEEEEETEPCPCPPGTNS